MRPWHLALLGVFSARRADGGAIPVRRRKARALLAYLALHLGQPQPREKLMALLWEDTDPERARHSLRQTLTLLRHDLAALAGIQPLLSGDAVCLDSTLVSVDVESFERLSGSTEPESLERAAALYRGDFLEGLDTVGETFESWLGVERDRLRATAVHVLDRLLA